MKCQFQAHSDMINTLEMCERNERVLVISASSDCSVAMYDVLGNMIGIFGQVRLVLFNNIEYLTFFSLFLFL